MRTAIIVVTLANQTAANAAAVEVGGADAEGTFTVPLASASDPTTPTHYWCSWGGLTEDQYGELQTLFTTLGSLYDGDDYTPGEVLALEGLVRYEPPSDL